MQGRKRQVIYPDSKLDKYLVNDRIHKRMTQFTTNLIKKKDFTAETITSNYRSSSPYKTCIKNLLFIKNETATYEAEGTQKSKQMKELFIHE